MVFRHDSREQRSFTTRRSFISSTKMSYVKCVVKCTISGVHNINNRQCRFKHFRPTHISNHYHIIIMAIDRRTSKQIICKDVFFLKKCYDLRVIAVENTYKDLFFKIIIIINSIHPQYQVENIYCSTVLKPLFFSLSQTKKYPLTIFLKQQ